VAAANLGIMTASFGILLLNGFVGYQWAEDGTTWSVWVEQIVKEFLML